MPRKAEALGTGLTSESGSSVDGLGHGLIRAQEERRAQPWCLLRGWSLGQESRVKLGLLPWLNVQLSLSFTTSPSCLFLPPRKLNYVTRVLFWGGMLCQHFPGPRGGGEGLVQGQQTWPKKENISFHTHTPHPAEHWEGKVGRTPRWAAPPPILSLSPAQPQKNGLFWEKHLLFQFPSLPPAGDQRCRDRAREASETQRA